MRTNADIVEAGLCRAAAAATRVISCSAKGHTSGIRLPQYHRVHLAGYTRDASSRTQQPPEEALVAWRRTDADALYAGLHVGAGAVARVVCCTRHGASLRSKPAISRGQQGNKVRHDEQKSHKILEWAKDATRKCKEGGARTQTLLTQVSVAEHVPSQGSFAAWPRDVRQP